MFRTYYVRIVAGMICFVAFFGIAIGLGTWLPSIMVRDNGMTIRNSLTYTIGMSLALPCASGFMMYAAERSGRIRLAITSFILAGLFAIGFVNTSTNLELLVVGFWMIFFTQLGGNSMQILISEMFATRARATGFGIASGTGRLGTAFIIPVILWLQNEYGADAVFAAVAATLAALFVPLLGPEARGRSLEALAAPGNPGIVDVIAAPEALG